jgi:hypothetical protein
MSLPNWAFLEPANDSLKQALLLYECDGLQSRQCPRLQNVKNVFWIKVPFGCKKIST